MSGALFAIVGPSGVGKDTLMEAAKACLPALHLVRRVITRPEAAGGEGFEGVSDAEFARRLGRGDFALHWQAHGLCYGIPSTVIDLLNTGDKVLFNGSRAMLSEAAVAFPDLKVIHVTARDEVLARRLAGRGRESAEQIAARLERAKHPLPPGLNITRVDNSGSLDDAITSFVHALTNASPAP